MDERVTNYCLKVGCGKFFYGNGCIEELDSEISRFGGRPLFIGGITALTKVFELTERKNYVNNGIICEHTGHCSKQWAQNYAALAEDKNSTVIVAVGGGKCIDLAKCVSVYSGLPIITIPTSIATCAATSAVCIMYDDNGRADGSVPMEREVDVCIADTHIIINAPKRLLAAGIFDSLAKLPEVIHNTVIENYRDCSLNRYISVGNSKIIYEFLIQEGLRAYDEGTNYNRFDDMILTNLILTSVVSGFSSGSGQLALAHGLYDFMRRSFPETSAPSLHGEIVGVGVLMQFAYNGESEKHIENYKNLMKEMGLPILLEQIGFCSTPENKKHLTDYLLLNASNGKSMDFERLNASMNVIL